MRITSGAFLVGLLASLCLQSCASHCETVSRAKIDPCDLEVRHFPKEPSANGKSYPTACFGPESGEPVLLLHAMNGASPDTVILAEKIACWGYRVFLPNLYMDDEKLGFGTRKKFRGISYGKKHEDWSPSAKESSGPIVAHLKEITEAISDEAGKPVVVIGNCVTGILPIELLPLEATRAGVLCQPATPVATLPELLFRNQPDDRKASLGVSEESLGKANEALSEDGKRLAGFHFSHDPVAAMVKFELLHHRFSNPGASGQFETYVLHPSETCPETWWTAHRETTAKRKMTVPHSTIISAQETSDREWFHQHLKAFLDSL